MTSMTASSHVTLPSQWRATSFDSYPRSEKSFRIFGADRGTVKRSRSFVSRWIPVWTPRA
jgi:hypothetical protein